MASTLTVPALVLRSVKGSPLTSDEIDSNFKILSQFGNALSALIGQSLQSDGTLNDNSVDQSSIQSRSVSASALQLNSLPVFKDTGTPNTYAITPDPAATSYEDGMVFIVESANANTGTSSLNVNGLGAVPINLYGTTSLVANQILAGGVFMVVYLGGTFLMVGSSAASTSGGGSGGSSGGLSGSILSTTLVQFSPAPVALPGAANNAVFNHNIGIVPMIVSGYLICNTAELGFTVGDQVPIDNFFDSTGRPAFGIDVNTASIVVTQNVDPPIVNQRSATAGTATAITPAKWGLVVAATAGGQQNAATIPSSLDFVLQNPSGAIGYGSKMFVGTFSNRGVDFALLNQIDLTTSTLVSAIVPAATTFNKCNSAPFRLGDAQDRAIVTSAGGTYTFFLNSPVAITQLWATASQNQKPVYADWSSGSIAAVYAMDCNVNSGSLINAITAVKLDGTGRHTYGTVALNLFDSNIVNVAAFTAIHNAAIDNNIVMVQWNPIKRRLYVMDDSTSLLHIFTMTNAGLDWKGWWALADSATKHGDLTYVKSIAVGGNISNSGDDGFMNLTIEFDLTTGVEKSICITCGNASGAGGTQPGRVTRVAWRESS